jgi:hypothetical protein
MQSAMGQDMGTLSELVANYMLYHWGVNTAARQVLTTGRNTTAHTPSGTGNRKLLTLANIKSAAKLLNKDNVPQEDRYMMFSADMYEQFQTLLDATTYQDFSRYFDADKGIIGKFYGFNILMRSTTLIYTEATPPVKKLPGAAAAATDNDSILFWHKDWIERAIGDIKIFEDTGNPAYYGDIYSLLAMAGGRVVDQNAVGVGAIIQDNG